MLSEGGKGGKTRVPLDALLAGVLASPLRAATPPRRGFSEPMLKTLRIRNVAIIEDLAVDFGPGLNVLTGETGAGKSIIADALGLAAGDRGDAARVRTGAERAVVEAVFAVGDSPSLRHLLSERGLDDAGDDLVVRREVSASGGRVFVNGSPTTLAALREVGDRLVELHGQHEHQDLLEPERHLALLDAFGGHVDEARSVERAHAAVLAARERLERLRALAAESVSRADDLDRRVREIDAAAPEPGESEHLERERHVLQHAGTLARLVDEMVELLYEGEPSGASLAAAAYRRAEEAASIDPVLEETAKRIEAARIELQDAGATLRDYRERTDFDPARLEAVEARRVLLERLRLRYGADESAILAHRETCARELHTLGSLDGETRSAEGTVAIEEGRYLEAAAALGGARREASERLRVAVEAQLRHLALGRATLSVRFSAARGPLVGAAAGAAVPLGRRGAERAEFLLAANPGEMERPLARVASGGELSRVMLALHLVLEGAAEGRVLVFDEVDAGVAGAAADAVGSRLARLGERSQVLCVTHLPQVAAHADHHYHVLKKVVAGRTRAEAKRLGRRERVDELARMLGGREVTAASRRNAEALLAAAGDGRASGRKS
ncbi:MAG: DNA repair protein RecN [Acidobacteriia bacterium]|nr:DNA repair protein RecN [Terriglobia bacterium]